jgi:hypothetical protein
MKKVINYFLMSTILLLSVSCEKNTETTISKKVELPIMEEIAFEKNWVLVGILAKVLIELSEGQATVVIEETIAPDGTSTRKTTKSCDGIGTCDLFIAYNGESANSSSAPFVGDYKLNGFFSKLPGEHVILAFPKRDNLESLRNRFFHSRLVNFLSEDFTIDNKKLLNKLGLKKPFVIRAGRYPVYQMGGYKFIVVKSPQYDRRR